MKNILLNEKINNYKPLKNSDIEKYQDRIFSYSKILKNKTFNNIETPNFSIYGAASGNGERLFKGSNNNNSKCLYDIKHKNKIITPLEIRLKYFNYLKQKGLPIKSIKIITSPVHNLIEEEVIKINNNIKNPIKIDTFKPTLVPKMCLNDENNIKLSPPGPAHILADYISEGKMKEDIENGVNIILLNPMEAIGMIIEENMIKFVNSGDKSIYFSIKEQEVDRGGGMVIIQNKIAIIKKDESNSKMFYKHLFQSYINLKNLLKDLNISKEKFIKMDEKQLRSLCYKKIYSKLMPSFVKKDFCECMYGVEYYFDDLPLILNAGFINLDGDYKDRACGLKKQEDIENINKTINKYFNNILDNFK